MSKKQVGLYQLYYMINCNENDNGTIDHICKTYRLRRRHRNKYRNLVGNTMALWIKQYLATFEAQFIKKLSNTEAELKKSVTYKKKRVKFFAQNLWKENNTKHLYVIFSGFQAKIIYISTAVPSSN